MAELLELLKAGGPLALAAAFGTGLMVVWKKLQDLRKFYEGDPGDEKTKETPGRLKAEREAAQQREDSVRAEYDTRLTDQRKHYELLLAEQKSAFETQIKDEREENKALYRELVKTIQDLGGPEEEL